MERKYKLGLYSLIVFGVVEEMMLSIGMPNNAGENIVNEEISSEMDFSDPTPAFTIVY